MKSSAAEGLPIWLQEIEKLGQGDTPVCPLMLAIREKLFIPKECLCDVPPVRTTFLNEFPGMQCFDLHSGECLARNKTPELAQLARETLYPKPPEQLKYPRGAWTQWKKKS